MQCAHVHSYNMYCAQGLPRWSSLKKKSVSGGSFIRGKSVKEELNCRAKANNKDKDSNCSLEK